MVDYLEKFIESAEAQRTEALFLIGATMTADADSNLYINVAPEHLDLLRADPEVRHAFTQHPRKIVEGISPVYAPNRHLVLELRSKNDSLTERMQSELGYKPVDIKPRG